MTLKTKCGFVSIVGRPNVGKSSLLNKLVGQKLSITSRKPQTTRHRIIGIDTENSCQTIYIDTPGLHVEEKRAINRLMNRSAQSSLSSTDIIIFVLDGTIWNKDDDLVMKYVMESSAVKVLVINKVDLIKDKEVIFPFIKKITSKYKFDQVIPMSAKDKNHIQDLKSNIQSLLPLGDFHYSEDHITDRSQRFLASEIIREKLMRFTGDELPYSVTVEIERFDYVKNNDSFHINGLILVERKGQKKMIIGKSGEKIKVIGRESRIDMEFLFDRKVFLELWVKVKSGWADDERTLRSLGYIDDL